MEVEVTAGLLLDNRITDSDRRLWMQLRLDKEDKSVAGVYTKTRLAERTRLSRGTIYNSLERLTAAGWCQELDGKPDAILNRSIKLGSRVKIPCETLECPNLEPRDVVLYGLLKVKGLRKQLGGKFTYGLISKYARRCFKTARRAFKALEEGDWLLTRRKNLRMAPYEIKVDTPSDKYCRQQIALTEMRLARPKGHGEALAVAMVMLVVEPTECQVGVRSSELPSPDTGEMMEMDIYLPKYKLVVEYNGEQHYNPTPFASKEDVEKQKRRDAAKAAILKDRHFKFATLVIGDLSIGAVIRKLQGLVPLRNLRFHQKLVKYLNYQGQRYQKKAESMRALET